MSDFVAVRLTVNGAPRDGRCPPRKLLVDFLREDLALTGTHVGCEHGICGACTILVDGEAARSCLMLAVQADGAEITTIEGLMKDGALHPLQAPESAQGQNDRVTRQVVRDIKGRRRRFLH